MGLGAIAVSVDQKTGERETLHSWRKHYPLHDWMTRLFQANGGTEAEPGFSVRLTAEDLDHLELDVIAGKLEYPGHSIRSDGCFISNARGELRRGMQITYSGSN